MERDHSLAPAVGAIITRGGRLLVVRRGHAPARGLWSLPGGRVEPGETDAEAVEREVSEETGLRVRAGRLAGVLERAPFEIRDYWCEVVGGELAAADDADDARWVDDDELRGLATTEGLVELLTAWGVLPLP